MSLLVYRVKKYENTAENDQYDEICEKLKKEYSGKEELCLFVANYNIGDCELDGIIFKNDAVISVEFKNYGGVLTARSNGHWTLSDGTIVKGGSRKTPYDQAKLNHIRLRDGLKYMIDAGRVQALIVFNQPIELNNQLDWKVRSWLHITDNKHFLQKLSNITDRYTDLSNDQLIGLIQHLGLCEEWLDKKYSDLSLREDKKHDDDPKFALDDYVSVNGESYSLTAETDYGKLAPLGLVRKYIQAAAGDVCGKHDDPVRNVKHLQGAVRLIKRSMTNHNPVIDLLNVYCILTLGEYKTNDAVLPLLESSYENAYKVLWDKFENKADFYKYISDVKEDMFEHGADRFYSDQMDMIEFQAELNRHSTVIKNIGWNFKN